MTTVRTRNARFRLIHHNLLQFGQLVKVCFAQGAKGINLDKLLKVIFILEPFTSFFEVHHGPVCCRLDDFPGTMNPGLGDVTGNLDVDDAGLGFE